MSVPFQSFKVQGFQQILFLSDSIGIFSVDLVLHINIIDVTPLAFSIKGDKVAILLIH